MKILVLLILVLVALLIVQTVRHALLKREIDQLNNPLKSLNRKERAAHTLATAEHLRNLESIEYQERLDKLIKGEGTSPRFERKETE